MNEQITQWRNRWLLLAGGVSGRVVVGRQHKRTSGDRVSPPPQRSQPTPTQRTCWLLSSLTLSHFLCTVLLPVNKQEYKHARIHAYTCIDTSRNVSPRRKGTGSRGQPGPGNHDDATAHPCDIHAEPSLEAGYSRQEIASARVERHDTISVRL